MGFGALIILAGILASTGPGRAALSKPDYHVGDRWVYNLRSSLDGLPGLNTTGGAMFRLSLNGIAQIDVAEVTSAAVRAETRASGFLNGTFAISANTTVGATGTFSSDTVELWEGQDYLPVASNSSSAFVVDVTLIITTPVLVDLWVNATNSYVSLPPFELGIGDSASAPFTSQLDMATSFSAFGLGQHSENRTMVDGTWNRAVLGLESVTVEAGTFSAYRLNESLGGFPGLVAIPPAGANETAWFSNDVGNYVRRVAYVNGSPVAEMRLKSYTYLLPPPGLSVIEIALLVAGPIAAVAAIVFVILHRRRARPVKAKGSSGAGPVGELPPKRPGGDP